MRLRYGIPPSPDIKPQFVGSLIDGISWMTTPVEVYFGASNEKAGHASGFFWKGSEATYLITNWHVVTSRDALTGKSLNEWSLFPQKIAYYGINWRSLDDNTKYFAPIRERLEMELYLEERPVWIQHPQFDRQRTDIVALKIDSKNVTHRDGEEWGLNRYKNASLFHGVGADAFVVGYPLDNYVDWVLPIWKRCSLASEPLIAIGGHPTFLIYGNTQAGMSGSPVIRRVFGPCPMSNLDIVMENIVTSEFVGVYGGRLLDKNEKDTGLAYAWHGRLIDEITASGVAGTLM